MPAGGRAAFARDTRGVVAIIFGVALLPIIALAGGATDHANAMRVRQALQNATDAGALATAATALTDETGAKADGARIAAFAFQNVAANAHVATPDIDVSYDPETGAVVMTGRTTMSPSFLGLLGIHSVPISVESRAAVKLEAIEIAVVVDTSGSMRNDMGALRDGLSELADTIDEATRLGEVKVSLVPFASSVNVGPHYRGASWMDMTGASPVHGQDFDEAVTRWELFDALDIPWGGCVMTRPGAWELSPEGVDPLDPASLFVPMFAPDGPGDANEQSSNPLDGMVYQNTYLDDEGGSCKGPVKRKRDDGTDKTDEEMLVEAQRRVCKYRGVKKNDIEIRSKDNAYGPNWRCTAQAITPLTDDLDVFRAEAATLRATAGTNSTAGFMWGWRTITAGEPFSGAAPHSQHGVRKVIILMADGENDIEDESGKGYKGINWSRYHPYGYLSHGALMTTRPASKDQTTAPMNARQLAACDAAKAQGIQIWTIGYDLNEKAAIDLLRDCASTDDQFVDAGSQDDLREAFSLIIERLATVRLTH